MTPQPAFVLLVVFMCTSSPVRAADSFPDTLAVFVNKVSDQIGADAVNTAMDGFYGCAKNGTAYEKAFDGENFEKNHSISEFKILSYRICTNILLRV